MEITFNGEYAVPMLLSGILSFIYKLAGESLNNKWKPLIAVFIGVGLGLIAIPYNGLLWNIKNIVDNVLYGFVVGTSASGVYEFYRGAAKPRE